MLSRKSKYALRALSRLSIEQDHGPMLIADLAEREGIPRKFLELILLELKNHGILQSRKGKGGGYLLNRAPSEIPLGEVMRVLDGPFAPLPCLDESGYARCEECKDEETCGIRAVMKDVRDAISQILDATSVADLLERSESLTREKDGTLMFHI